MLKSIITLCTFNKYIIPCLAILFFANSLFSQDTTSVSLSTHSPKKATILSAVVPGAGQIYNKKYWKLPIIYGGFGAIGYFIYENNSRYSSYKKAYSLRTDGDPNTIDDYPLYSEEGLLQAKNYYRRNTELSVIVGVILYALNIVDAAVDAHLYDFDISDDLSIKIQPALQRNLFDLDEKFTTLKITLSF